MTNIIEVENKMITLRNQQVILDSDVAELYGVETKRINEAVSNNPEKFPEGYVWELDGSEKTEVVENFDHLHKLKYSPQFPKAFTEKGLYMLATILKSPKAMQTTIAIVEAYAMLKFKHSVKRSADDEVTKPKEENAELKRRLGNTEWGKISCPQLSQLSSRKKTTMATGDN